MVEIDAPFGAGTRSLNDLFTEVARKHGLGPQARITDLKEVKPFHYVLHIATDTAGAERRRFIEELGFELIKNKPAHLQIDLMTRHTR